MTDKKVPSLGSATKRVLADFLDELKIDQEKKQRASKIYSQKEKHEKNDKTDENDIRLFSKKLSEKNEGQSFKKENENDLDLRKCSKIVLSDEETNKLLSIKDKENLDD